MKKLIATLLVLALAIPAMAADVSMDSTGTITLTVGAGEVVRGLAIVVDSETEITAVTDTDAIFNVFMDAAYDAESATAGSYVLGAGSPVANPAAAGGIALPATSISLCMGVLDESGAQGGAGEGTYTIGVLETCGAVTIAADTLRGGIVGDAIVAGTIDGGTVECGSGEPYIGADVQVWIDLGRPASWLNNRQCRGDANGAEDFYGRNNALHSFVGPSDIVILLDGYKKAYTGTEAWIAADFTHSKDFYGRNNALSAQVGPSDIAVLIANYKTVVPADCGQVAAE